MSRKGKSQKKTSRKTMSQKDISVKRDPIIQRLLLRILSMPRLLRIALVALFSLAVALVVSLVLFYDSIFYAQGLLSLLVIITTVLGLATYLVGWHLIVGTRGETPPLRPAIMFYLGTGFLALIMVVLWLIQVSIIGNT